VGVVVAALQPSKVGAFHEPCFIGSEDTHLACKWES
jgi:hypothetical protein